MALKVLIKRTPAYRITKIEYASRRFNFLYEKNVIARQEPKKDVLMLEPGNIDCKNGGFAKPYNLLEDLYSVIVFIVAVLSCFALFWALARALALVFIHIVQD